MGSFSCWVIFVSLVASTSLVYGGAMFGRASCQTCYNLVLCGVNRILSFVCTKELLVLLAACVS